MHDGDREAAADRPDAVFREAARRVSELRHGPYSDLATVEAAGLLAESVRYLNHAAARDGMSDPAAAAAVLAYVCSAVYRFPRLFGLLGDWAAAEAAAGRLADDDGCPGWQLAESARSVLRTATEDADALARCLGAAHSLTSTFPGAG